MKRIGTILAGIVLVLSLLTTVHAQEFGKLRALKQRADTVVKQKNNFVTMVLNAYKIPHQVNDQGIVVRILLQDKWHDITAVEIVPLFKEGQDAAREITGHELYFFTAEGILDLVSDLTIH